MALQAAIIIVFDCFSNTSKTLVFEHYRRLADSPSKPKSHYDLPADRIIFETRPQIESCKREQIDQDELQRREFGRRKARC